MKSQLLTLALVAAAGAAMAQNTPYATVDAVSGAVTVSGKDSVVSATRGMELKQGSNVVTSNAGTVTVKFSNGCTVTLKPGQMLLVQESECAALLANSGAPAGTGGLTVPQMVGLGIGGGVVIYELTKSDKKTAATPPVVETPVETPVVDNKPPSKTPSKTPVSGS